MGYNSYILNTDRIIQKVINKSSVSIEIPAQTYSARETKTFSASTTVKNNADINEIFLKRHSEGVYRSAVFYYPQNEATWNVYAVTWVEQGVLNIQAKIMNRESSTQQFTGDGFSAYLTQINVD